MSRELCPIVLCGAETAAEAPMVEFGSACSANAGYCRVIIPANALQTKHGWLFMYRLPLA
jgi:hypothetical protein